MKHSHPMSCSIKMINFTTTVEIDADTQDYLITIPDEILQELGWKEGDTLDWHITDSKQIIITKIKNAEESRGKDQDSNISEGTQEDWEDFWYESESEGKEYDEYIQATAKETFGQAYHSPEGQGSWD